jgi:hypothetical protein
MEGRFTRRRSVLAEWRPLTEKSGQKKTPDRQLATGKSVHQTLVDVLLEVEEVRYAMTVAGLSLRELRALGLRLLEVESEMEQVTLVVNRRVRSSSSRGGEVVALLTRLSRVRETITRTVVTTSGLLEAVGLSGDGERYERAAAVWRGGDSRRLRIMGEDAEAGESVEFIEEVTDEESECSSSSECEAVPDESDGNEEWHSRGSSYTRRMCDGGEQGDFKSNVDGGRYVGQSAGGEVKQWVKTVVDRLNG